jgi:hypothetical protein
MVGIENPAPSLTMNFLNLVICQQDSPSCFGTQVLKHHECDK